MASLFQGNRSFGSDAAVDELAVVEEGRCGDLVVAGWEGGRLAVADFHVVSSRRAPDGREVEGAGHRLVGCEHKSRSDESALGCRGGPGDDAVLGQETLGADRIG